MHLDLPHSMFCILNKTKSSTMKIVSTVLWKTSIRLPFSFTNLVYSVVVLVYLTWKSASVLLYLGIILAVSFLISCFLTFSNSANSTASWFLRASIQYLILVRILHCWQWNSHISLGWRFHIGSIYSIFLFFQKNDVMWQGL